MRPETTRISAPATITKPQKISIAYIDNLKVLAIILVVLNHCGFTYIASGPWYFQQRTELKAALPPMMAFVAINQSFLMGILFFLSALFVGPSYQKKGPVKFLINRLKRLGIPLAFYSVVLSPVLFYLVKCYGDGETYSFIYFIRNTHNWINVGVMWFVAALLLFNLIYLGYKRIWPNVQLIIKWPDNRQWLIAGVVLGLVSFLVRLVFPVGWVLSPLGFQLGHFPQYIAAFIFGLVAFNNKWMDSLELKQGRAMLAIALCMVLLVLPAIFVCFLATRAHAGSCGGGWNPFAFVYALWEQITGVAILVAMLCIAKYKWNSQTSLMKTMSANALTVYMFHPLVLVGISLIIKNLDVEPVVKLLAIIPAGLIISFVFAGLLRKVPMVKNFL